MQPFEQIRHRLPTLALLGLLASPLMASAAAPLFARFTLDRPTPYAGEAFQLTLRLYIAGGNLDKQVSIGGLPAATDLQLKGFEELPVESTTLDGTPYEVRPFQTWARAPHEGTIKLAPQLDGTWIQSFRSFFFTQETRRPARIPSEDLMIPVTALPETGRPETFSGLAGQYRFKATATPLDIAPGDLISLTITIEGDWLPPHLLLPQLETSPSLKVYEMKPVPEESSPVRRVYRQTVVPQDGAPASLPPLALCTFDTRLKTYKTQTAGPFPITFHAERVVPQPAYIPPRREHPTTTDLASATPATIAEPGPSWPGRLWNRLAGIKEGVIQGTDATRVKLAPSDTATELFTLKPGSVVRLDSTQEDWLRISCAKGIGWLPASAVKAR